MLHTGRSGQYLSSGGFTGAHSKTPRAGRFDRDIRRMVSFRLNDEIIDVPNDNLHISAASFIRQHTQCKASHPQLVATAAHDRRCRTQLQTCNASQQYTDHIVYSLQSVKVSCNEGGCGACAVELLSPAGERTVLPGPT